MKEKSNFRRGSVELLSLFLLGQRDYYGYELCQEIKKRSDGVIDIKVGSLYPALYKLIDKGHISEDKRQAGKRMIRVYYHLESSGEKRLAKLLNDYYQTNNAIQSVMNYNIEEGHNE